MIPYLPPLPLLRMHSHSENKRLRGRKCVAAIPFQGVVLQQKIKCGGSGRLLAPSSPAGRAAALLGKLGCMTSISNQKQAG